MAESSSSSDEDNSTTNSPPSDILNHEPQNYPARYKTYNLLESYSLSHKGDETNIIKIKNNKNGDGGDSAPETSEEQITESLDRLSTDNLDKSDDSSSSDEHFRKKVRVGNHYQARIPKCQLSTTCPLMTQQDDNKLLWSPFDIDPAAVDEFLATISRLSQPIIPSGTHLRDNEQALYVLKQSNYGVELALDTIKNTMPEPATEDSWSEVECKNFENGLLSFGKNFFLIQKYKVTTRKVGELVQFYYLWKKTERYDLFASRLRTGKKKYSLNPGTSDLMCRYFGAQMSGSNGNRSFKYFSNPIFNPEQVQFKPSNQDD